MAELDGDTIVDAISAFKAIAKYHKFKPSGFYQERWEDPTDSKRYMEPGSSFGELRVRFYSAGGLIATQTATTHDQLGLLKIKIQEFCQVTTHG